MDLLMASLLAVLGVATLLYLYMTRHFKHWTNKGVASTTPSSFWGDMKKVLLQQEFPGDFLRKIYDQGTGQPYIGFFLLDKPALLLRDPEVIKNILIKDFTHFLDRYADSSLTADSLGTRGMFLAKGFKWRILRTSISPMFTSGRMKKLHPLIVECASEMDSYLTEVAQENKAVEVKELMAKTSTDIISTCAFGISANSIRNPDSEFRKYGKIIFVYTFRRSLESTSMWLLPWLVKLARFSFFPAETTEFFRKVFWETLIAREESKVKRHDLIDQLIQLKNKGKIDEEDHEKTTCKEVKPDKEKVLQTFDFEGDDLLAQATVFFAAGFETTASTMTFTLYELALQPDIQKRLRTEIREVLARHGGQYSYEAVNEMKYLDMVLSETLRKYPPLPFLDRVCLKEYTIPGTDVVIEKGTPIFIPLLGLHYDPEYFPEPDRFDPERFSEDEKHSRPQMSYLPFGEGPRVCIGMRFGQVSAKTELANLICHLEVLPCKDTPIPLQMDPRASLLATVGGIPLTFREVE